MSKMTPNKLIKWSKVSSASQHRFVGFPRESVIGAQVVSYYTGEVPEIAEKHSVSAHLYADDTQLYLPFSLTDGDPERERERERERRERGEGERERSFTDGRLHK